MHPLVAHSLLLIIVAASILLMLLRPRNIPEVYWVGSGALLLIALGLVPLRLAARAVAKGTDVYLFLAGMMLLSEIARENGVFDWISAVAVTHAQQSGRRLFLLLYLAGVCVTACMSNDATAIVLTPAVLASVRRARTDPLPFLFACAMIANAASFVLPISNPANLVVFHAAMPPLGAWLVSFLLPSALSILVTYATLRWYFRRTLVSSIDCTREHAELTSAGKLVLAGLALVVIVLLVASALGRDLGLPTFIAALVIATATLLRSRSNPLAIAKEISWSTLALVAALFVMVEAVDSVGALNFTRHALAAVQRLTPAAAALITAFVVGVANNLINNLPLGLIAANTLTSTHTRGLLADVILIAVDVGPNLSVTGSLATILWLLSLRREGLNVTFLDFLKVGAIAMPAALLAAVAGRLCLQLLH